MRRFAAAPSSAQLALPLAETSPVERVLDAIETARQRALDLLPPTFKPRPDLSLVPIRPDGSRLDQAPYTPAGTHKYVERKGRLRKDGTRAGARIMRKMTVYLEPLVAEEFEVFCARNQVDFSEVVNELVRDLLERQ